MRYFEISEGIPKTRFKVPLGIPASSKALTNSAVLVGVSSGPLTIILHPAARAGAIYLAVC